ncbi:MAG: hypothetical protein JW995_02440 [Melioribacteraceae bacterium]|nr:hypothetical protein [Melioribacteraceae bacterium]
MIKKRIIYTLLAVSLILLLMNVYFEYSNAEKEKRTVYETSKSEIEKLFIKVVLEFGIKRDWITTGINKNTEYDSLSQIFYIGTPPSIQIINIINDLSYSMKKLNVDLRIHETKNNTRSEIDIYSNNYLKLRAVITHNPDYKREYSEIAFLVESDLYDLGNLTEQSKKIFVPFTFLFKPSNELKSNIESVMQLNSSYAILICDNIPAEDFVLEPTDSKNLISRNVVNIISLFGRERLYIIDDKSLLYSSIIYNFIRDEFGKRNVNLVKLSSFSDLRGKDLSDIASIVDFHSENGKGKEPRTLVIGLDDFVKIQEQIKAQKKKGSRFTKVY